MGETPVVVITYGHSPEMTYDALRSAVAARSDGLPVRPIILDDCSTAAPQVRGVETHSTPGNGGYAAAVNHAVRAFADDAKRIVFINPDAIVDLDGLAALVECDSAADVVVPSIIVGDRLENVRSTLTLGPSSWGWSLRG